jgi:chromosome transmission fidelity protein 1
MKTVNQCIGRSIRHIHDYAAIVLLDGRYSQSRVIQLLPSWLASEVRPCATFHDVRAKLMTFFDARKAATAAAIAAPTEDERKDGR